MRRVAPWVLAIGLLAGGASAAPPELPAAPVVSGVVGATLPNGLRLSVQEDHGTPRVALHFRYDVGYGDDPDGATGLAELIGALLREGSTPTLPAATRSALPEAVGAHHWDRKVMVNIDGTHVTLSGPAHELDLALWMERDVIASLADGVEPAMLARHVKALRGTKISPPWKEYAELRSRLHGPTSPYGRARVWDWSQTETVTVDVVRQRLRQAYGAKGIALTVVGDVDQRAAQTLVASRLGTIPAGVTMERRIPDAAAVASRSRLDLGGAPKVALLWITPAYFAEGDPELDVVARLLKARLTRALVNDRKVAASVSVSQSSMKLRSDFAIIAELAGGHGADEVIALVDAELQRLRAGEATDAEVGRARTLMFLENLDAWDSLPGRARWLSWLASGGRDPSAFTRHVAAARSVDARAVGTIVEKHLPANARLVVDIVPVAGGSK